MEMIVFTSIIPCLLSVFLACKEAADSSPGKAHARQRIPKDGVAVIAGLGCVAQLVVHFDFDLRVCTDRDDLIHGQHIGGGGVVGHLGHAVITAAKPLDKDFAFLIRGEHLFIAIRPGNAERKALDLLV